MVEIKGLEKLAPRDYPGHLSATVFTGGCNFRCPYCHNPDLVLNPKAMSTLPPEEFQEFLESRRGWLEGVCLTGGEPLLHPDLGEFLAQLKARKLLVKLDTNGSFPDRLQKMYAEGLLDCVAMDIKAPLRMYPQVAGREVEAETISASMTLIRQSGFPYIFRTTVVPGWVDTPEISEIVETLLEENDSYSLQPYMAGNTLEPEFSQKYSSCSKQHLEELAQAVRSRIPGVKT